MAEDGGLEDDSLEVGRTSSESESDLDPESERAAVFRAASRAQSRALEDFISRRSSLLPVDSNKGRGDDLGQYDNTVPIYAYNLQSARSLTSDISDVNPDDTRYLCLRSLVRVARIIPGRNVLPAADRAFRAACNPDPLIKTATASCTGNETNCRVTTRQQNEDAHYNKRPGWGIGMHYANPHGHNMTALATTAFGPQNPTTLIEEYPENRWICGVCLGIMVPIRSAVAYLVSVNVGIECDSCKVFLKTQSHR